MSKPISYSINYNDDSVGEIYAYTFSGDNFYDIFDNEE